MTNHTTSRSASYQWAKHGNVKPRRELWICGTLPYICIFGRHVDRFFPCLPILVHTLTTSWNSSSPNSFCISSLIHSSLHHAQVLLSIRNYCLLTQTYQWHFISLWSNENFFPAQHTQHVHSLFATGPNLLTSAPPKRLFNFLLTPSLSLLLSKMATLHSLFPLFIPPWFYFFPWFPCPFNSSLWGIFTNLWNCLIMITGHYHCIHNIVLAFEDCKCGLQNPPCDKIKKKENNTQDLVVYLN